jgi:transketolase
MTTMRERFYAMTADALEQDENVWAVFADIGVAEMRPHPRLVNVGIREQLLIGVAAGLALVGKRPVVHSYAPFLVERPWEQIKLDLNHNDASAILVSNGASYDSSQSGRTHQAPEDVALLGTLPDWRIEAPGHPDEFERTYARALRSDDRVYIRTTLEQNHAPVHGDGLVVLRPQGRGTRPGYRPGGGGWTAGASSQRSPLVVAVGPTLSPVLEATADLDVGVAYLTTVRPFPHDAFEDVDDVVLVEPYLAGTSAHELTKAIGHRPHRLLALGIENPELRKYGTPAEHRAAHGLDARGIRAALTAFVT